MLSFPCLCFAMLACEHAQGCTLHAVRIRLSHSVVPSPIQAWCRHPADIPRLPMQEESKDFRVGHNRGDPGGQPLGRHSGAGGRVWRNARPWRSHSRADARAQPLGCYPHSRARGHRGHAPAQPLGRCHPHPRQGAALISASLQRRSFTSAMACTLSAPACVHGESLQM